MSEINNNPDVNKSNPETISTDNSETGGNSSVEVNNKTTEQGSQRGFTSNNENLVKQQGNVNEDSDDNETNLESTNNKEKSDTGGNSSREIQYSIEEEGNQRGFDNNKDIDSDDNIGIEEDSDKNTQLEEKINDQGEDDETDNLGLEDDKDENQIKEQDNKIVIEEDGEVDNLGLEENKDKSEVTDQDNKIVIEEDDEVDNLGLEENKDESEVTDQDNKIVIEEDGEVDNLGLEENKDESEVKEQDNKIVIEEDDEVDNLGLEENKDKSEVTDQDNKIVIEEDDEVDNLGLEENKDKSEIKEQDNNIAIEEDEETDNLGLEENKDESEIKEQDNKIVIEEDDEVDNLGLEENKNNIDFEDNNDKQPIAEFITDGNNLKEKKYTLDDISDLKNTENFGENAIKHIFEGEKKQITDRNGNIVRDIDGNIKYYASGYHYDNIENTAGKIKENSDIIQNSNGTFNAKVEVDGLDKRAKSTFFPSSYSPQEVVDSINQAYNNKVPEEKPKSSFLGKSDRGLEIRIVLDENGLIKTAYPTKTQKI